MYDDYRWRRYDGRVTYFRARVRLPVIMCLMFAWRRVAPQLRVVDVPGEHDDLLDAKHAPRLGPSGCRRRWEGLSAARSGPAAARGPSRSRPGPRRGR